MTTVTFISFSCILYEGEKKFMKTKITTLVLLTALLFTFGCSKGENRGDGGESRNLARSMAAGIATEAPQMAYAKEMSLKDEAQLSGTDNDSISANPNEAERKLVKRADVRIRVENLETADGSVSSLMEKYEAYAASTYIAENSYSYSIRVPSKFYEIFLAEMNGMGRLINRSENTEDVTLRYYDLEGRLETKKELLKTFQAYLRRATNIEEILKVEARIAELQYDIEGTGQQLRHLANRVDYATIELNLLGPAAAAQRRSVTFGEQIRQMFGGFGGFISGLAMVIIGIIIYGIPILLLVVFLAWLLFGRIGLIRRLWQLVKDKKQA